MTHWTIKNRAYAERADGVVAKFVFSGGQFPYAVSRGQGKTYEFLAGAQRSCRAFKTLAGAMKAADKAWPFRPEAA